MTRRVQGKIEVRRSDSEKSGSLILNATLEDGLCFSIVELCGSVLGRSRCNEVEDNFC